MQFGLVPFPSKSPGDQINFKGTIYTIERAKQVYYVVINPQGKRYNLRISAVEALPTIGKSAVTPKAEAVPTKLPGDTVEFRGVVYTIERINKVNYVVRHPNGKQYNLKFAAVA